MLENGRDVVILSAHEAKEFERVVHTLLRVVADPGKKGWQRRWYKLLKEVDPHGLLETLRRAGQRGDDE